MQLDLKTIIEVLEEVKADYSSVDDIFDSFKTNADTIVAIGEYIQESNRANPPQVLAGAAFTMGLLVARGLMQQDREEGNRDPLSPGLDPVADGV